MAPASAILGTTCPRACFGHALRPRTQSAADSPDQRLEVLARELRAEAGVLAENCGGELTLLLLQLDRVEVWSAGKYPNGITPESLVQTHPSVQRNPIIAEVFHRAGLIEKWGRGTNRVAEMCRAAGIALPEFAEIGGAAVVTFRVKVAAGLPGAAGEVTPEVTPEVQRLLSSLEGEMTRREIQDALTLKDPDHVRETYLAPGLGAGLVEMTIPGRPRSRLQKYRLADKGRALVARKKGP